MEGQTTRLLWKSEGLVWRGRPREWGIGVEGQTTRMGDSC